MKGDIFSSLKWTWIWCALSPRQTRISLLLKSLVTDAVHCFIVFFVTRRCALATDGIQPLFSRCCFPFTYYKISKTLIGISSSVSAFFSSCSRHNRIICMLRNLWNHMCSIVYCFCDFSRAIIKRSENCLRTDGTKHSNVWIGKLGHKIAYVPIETKTLCHWHLTRSKSICIQFAIHFR